MEVQNFRKPFIHLFSCSTGYYLYDVNKVILQYYCILLFYFY